MSDMPRILVSGSSEGYKNYEAAVRRAGGEPVGGYCPVPDLTCDGLLLCGGGDIDSALYHQENNGSDPPDLARDKAEMMLVSLFLAARRPILGICRGLQIINVAMGGSLTQNLPPDSLCFHGRADRDLVHPLRTAPGSLMERLYGARLAVNSAHHQAIEHAAVSILPTAWSEGGVIEAIEHKTLPILGVQFHPERMSGELRRPDTADGAPVFEWFIEQCRGVK